MTRGSTRPDRRATFDDRDSFTLEIDTGEVAITTALLNSYVFAYAEAPVKNIQVTVKGSRLIREGTIHKSGDLPLEIEGPIPATADSNIRLQVEKIKSKAGGANEGPTGNVLETTLAPNYFGPIITELQNVYNSVTNAPARASNLDPGAQQKLRREVSK